MEPRCKLTKRAVDAAHPKSVRYVLWDIELKGFGLRVEASGTKTYILRYRPKGHGVAGPKRFLTIGRHGPLAPEQARDRARALLGEVATGSDPAAKRAASRATLLIGEAVLLFMKDHVCAKRKAATARDYEWLLTRTLVARFGTVEVDKLERHQISKLHAQMANAPYLANRAVAVIASLYAYLGKAGHVPAGFNPARGIERYQEQGRERYLTNEELKRIGAALEEAETVGLPWAVRPTSLASKHLADRPPSSGPR